MQAVRFHTYGDADVLAVEDVAIPTPGPDQVRLRVAGTTYNPVEGAIRAGFMTQAIPVALPHTPGVEVSGTVDALGEGVNDLAVGDAVVGFLPLDGDGASSDYALAPAAVLTTAPTTVPLADAAALPLVGLTAWQALFDHGGLTAGQRVLINGAGGSVGGYAVQLARGAGAHVIATASPRDAARVAELGADEVLDHTAAPVAAQLDEPVDLLVNLANVDADTLAALAARVRDGGVVVTTTVRVPAPSDPARGVRGVDLFVRSDADQLAHLVRLVDGGALRVEVAERVGLADVADVHARAGAGALRGRVVVIPTA
ncbi:MAG: NADP-dependent oxidoreductase [Kineosporiaceae bacterium]